MFRAAVLTLAMLCSGCFFFALGTTRDQELSRSIGDTRVTEHEADVDGQLCYVDHQTTARVRRRVPGVFRLGVGLELVGGGLVSLGGDPYYLYMLPVLLDGLMTMIYLAGEDKHERHRTSWESSNDTGACKR
jgi:hypothetical protein